MSELVCVYVFIIVDYNHREFWRIRVRGDGSFTRVNIEVNSKMSMIYQQGYDGYQAWATDFLGEPHELLQGWFS